MNLQSLKLNTNNLDNINQTNYATNGFHGWDQSHANVTPDPLVDVKIYRLRVLSLILVWITADVSHTIFQIDWNNILVDMEYGSSTWENRDYNCAPQRQKMLSLLIRRSFNFFGYTPYGDMRKTYKISISIGKFSGKQSNFIIPVQVFHFCTNMRRKELHAD